MKQEISVKFFNLLIIYWKGSLMWRNDPERFFVGRVISFKDRACYSFVWEISLMDPEWCSDIWVIHLKDSERYSCVREIIFKYTVCCRMRDSLKGPQWYSNVWQTVLKMLDVLFCCTRDPLQKLLNIVLLHERYEVPSKDPSVVSKILL